MTKLDKSAKIIFTMKTKSKEIEQNALEYVANLMCLSARTAPKTKGIDNIITLVVKKSTIKRLIKEMEQVAKKEGKPGFYRDAQNLKQCSLLVLIAVKSNAAGIKYCGFCGYKNCKELSKTKGICAFNSIDLGIAAGSAVCVASLHHVDNRLMYSAGRAAINLGLVDKKKVRQSLGIPLSASGKNIFFDRKI